MTTQFKLEDKERTIAATLQCYAPGDGSLSFVFQDHKGNATGDKVTRRDVLAFLEQRRPDLKTWTIVNLHGHGFKLFKPVTRTAPDEVQLDNRCYRYTK